MPTPAEVQQQEMEFVTIESLVPADHLLRRIEETIDLEFIRERVRHLCCADNGRPALDMVDELQRRNYSQSATRAYIRAVEDCAKYFHRSPDRLGPKHIREYQAHLFRDRKLSPGTIQIYTAGLRFLFVKTLGRAYLCEHLPFPKCPRRLPTVLSQQEAARLIASARNLMHRTMLMVLYATGLRRLELCHLKVADIDSERMQPTPPSGSLRRNGSTCRSRL